VAPAMDAGSCVHGEGLFPSAVLAYSGAVRREALDLYVTRESAGELLEPMEKCRQAHGGWLNLIPELDRRSVEEGAFDEDAAVNHGGIFGMFGMGSPEPPVGTWVAGHLRRRGIEHDRVGISHQHGAHALRAMAGRGLVLPDGWGALQDHVRRGIVIAIPEGSDLGEVVDWLLAALELLAPVPLTGNWQAQVFAPRTRDRRKPR